MLTHIVFALGVVTQSAPSPPGDRRSGDPGVRVWVSDTLYQVGAGARVYVQLREPGYLVVLHIDAMGRIRVLYPAAPGDQVVVPAAAPFEVAGTGDSITFRVETRGRGTLLAARSPHPLPSSPCATVSGGITPSRCCCSRAPATPSPRCWTSPTGSPTVSLTITT
jgi:hypothetical protein